MKDNGPEFILEEFSSFLNSLDILHQLMTPYDPSSYGVVERVNRTIQSLIKSSTDCNTNWLEHLPKSLIIYNNTIHSELNMSPAKFLLSRKHNYRRLPLVQSTMQAFWKSGNPNFSSFKVGQYVIMEN